jgi:hypothetical protein
VKNGGGRIFVQPLLAYANCIGGSCHEVSGHRHDGCDGCHWKRLVCTKEWVHWKLEGVPVAITCVGTWNFQVPGGHANVGREVGAWVRLFSTSQGG